MSFEGGQEHGEGWIDVSLPVRSGMVHWPGDPEIRIERPLDLARGDPATVSMLSLGAHTGTHMDAPLHFIAGAASMDELPFSATIGPARVIPIGDPEAIRAEELIGHRIAAGERLLFRTLNSIHAWGQDRFVEDFVYISVGAARHLAERRVRTVGVDYLSVGGYRREGRETHLELLGAGIWIIEGLNLAAVEPGLYDLICLPLRIAGGEGAPARAIVRPRR